MANDNADLLAMMADLLKATDRQTEENKRAIEQVGAKFEGMLLRVVEVMSAGFERVDKRFEQVDKRFEQIDKRFEQMDKRFEGLTDEVRVTNQRLDTVIEHVGHLTETVDSINRRVGHIEKDLPNYIDIVRRLTVVETIVLNKAS